MEPAVIIAAISLVTTIAITVIARGGQKSDKLEDRMGVAEVDIADLKAHKSNMRELLEGLKKDIHAVNEKLDRLVK